MSTALQYIKRLKKQGKIELEFLSKSQYFKRIKQVSGETAPPRSIARFYPKEKGIKPAIFVRTTRNGKIHIPKALMQKAIAHEIGHLRTPTATYLKLSKKKRESLAKKLEWRKK